VTSVLQVLGFSGSIMVTKGGEGRAPSYWQVVVDRGKGPCRGGLSRPHIRGN